MFKVHNISATLFYSKHSFFVVLLTLFFMIPVPDVQADTTQPQPGVSYLIHNKYLGDSFALTLNYDKTLSMASVSSDDNQKWLFEYAVSPSHTYLIINAAQPDSVVASDGGIPALQPKPSVSAASASQKWQFFTKIFRNTGDAHYLTNVALGFDKGLDSDASEAHKVFIEDLAKNTTGSQWYMEAAPISIKISEPTITVIQLPDSGSPKTVNPVINGPKGTDFYVSGPMRRETFNFISPYFVKAPCSRYSASAKNSILLSNADYKLLSSNDCSTAEQRQRFELVAGFFTMHEKAFLEGIQKTPEDYLVPTDEMLSSLRARNGKILLTTLSNYIFGKILILKDKKSSEWDNRERAVVAWIEEGVKDIHRKKTDLAIKEYNQWKANPCAYDRPVRPAEQERFEDNACRNNLAMALTGYRPPELNEFRKYGAVRISELMLSERIHEFSESTKDFTGVILYPTAIAGFATVVTLADGSLLTTLASQSFSLITTTIGIDMGPEIGVIVIAGSSPLTGLAAVSGVTVGVVVAVVGSGVKIYQVAEDANIPKHLREDLDDLDKRITFAKLAGEADGQAHMLLAFHDAMGLQNNVRTLPVRVSPEFYKR